ncbi:MAG TPA: hypothetical protein VEK06_00780 [Myxococcota bacterium]|nr:hypothetical protein [Myxococcota bacterium]
MFFILFAALSLNLMAGLSVKNKKPQEPQKIADEVQKALAPSDISSILARIRVEDAQFRAFNLFLPPCELGAMTPIEKKRALEVRQVLERDLAISGSFHLMTEATKLGTDELLKQKGAEGSSRCQMSFRGQKLRAIIDHKNFLSGKTSRRSFEQEFGQHRRLAHLMAQSIFEEFIGPEDLFLLQIAAVKRQKNNSQIVMFDFDGHNESAISTNTWGKASPFFAPDGKSILYSITNNEGHGIVEQTIGLPTFQFRLKVTGLNIDPRVLPDNNGLLATLSFGKMANIYRTTRAGDIIGPVTENKGMNLSPAISPDGKMLAFVSNRGGSAQIYEQELSGQIAKTAAGAPIAAIAAASTAAAKKTPEATRLTYKGDYNQTPQYSPDGRLIAFTGRDQNAVFDIYLYERESKNTLRVTQNQGRNQEPFFTPSGRFIIFVSMRDGHKEPDVYLANLQGNHQYRLTNTGGYYSPIVRPLQK